MNLKVQRIVLQDLPSLFTGLTLPTERQECHNLLSWDMARDDAPILAAIVNWLSPHRHLEFGTWKGFGTCLVLENSDATVWTINLKEGERNLLGGPIYSEPCRIPKRLTGWRRFLGKKFENREETIQTDGGEMIGALIHDKNLGSRVNQVFCDSREWDTRCYPPGFFDSVFIDGGHQTEVVLSDTLKSLTLLRKGGLMIWHDFCPDSDVRRKFPHVETVIQGIEKAKNSLLEESVTLWWPYPSWLLLGIKGNVPISSSRI